MIGVSSDPKSSALTRSQAGGVYSEARNLLTIEQSFCRRMVPPARQVVPIRRIDDILVRRISRIRVDSTGFASTPAANLHDDDGRDRRVGDRSSCRKPPSSIVEDYEKLRTSPVSKRSIPSARTMIVRSSATPPPPRKRGHEFVEEGNPPAASEEDTKPSEKA